MTENQKKALQKKLATPPAPRPANLGKGYTWCRRCGEIIACGHGRSHTCAKLDLRHELENLIHRLERHARQNEMAADDPMDIGQSAGYVAIEQRRMIRLLRDLLLKTEKG